MLPPPSAGGLSPKSSVGAGAGEAGASPYASERGSGDLGDLVGAQFSQSLDGFEAMVPAAAAAALSNGSASATATAGAQGGRYKYYANSPADTG